MPLEGIQHWGPTEATIIQKYSRNKVLAKHIIALEVSDIAAGNGTPGVEGFQFYKRVFLNDALCGVLLRYGKFKNSKRTAKATATGVMNLLYGKMQQIQAQRISDSDECPDEGLVQAVEELAQEIALLLDNVQDVSAHASRYGAKWGPFAIEELLRIIGMVWKAYDTTKQAREQAVRLVGAMNSYNFTDLNFRIEVRNITIGLQTRGIAFIDEYVASKLQEMS